MKLHLPMAPVPADITLGVRISAKNLGGGGTDTQCIASTSCVSQNKEGKQHLGKQVEDQTPCPRAHRRGAMVITKTNTVTSSQGAGDEHLVEAFPVTQPRL